MCVRMRMFIFEDDDVDVYGISSDLFFLCKHMHIDEKRNKKSRTVISKFSLNCIGAIGCINSVQVPKPYLVYVYVYHICVYSTLDSVYLTKKICQKNEKTSCMR